MDENEVSEMSTDRNYPPLELQCRVCRRRFTEDHVQYIPEEDDRWDLPDRVWACIRWPHCRGRDADIVIIEDPADSTNAAKG
jgi:hypothetical protein